MEKEALLHDGPSLKIYATKDDDKIIQHFTDQITAYYKTKRAIIHNKGFYCNGISAVIFNYLQEHGVRTHFIKQLSDVESLCYRTKSIPLEIIVRNLVAGSLAERLGIEVGLKPESPIIDLCYKSDELGNPLINDSHALALGIVEKNVLEEIYKLSQRINEILPTFFEKIGIILVDFKLEFGYLSDGSVVLRDYICPDNARFWDLETHSSLDKDRFRRDQGDISKGYRTIYDRLLAMKVYD